MKDIKFKVYYEFEHEGELHKGIESEASWFLLTQTGKLLSYGPFKPPRGCEKEYKKIIPLFYTGLEDQNGKEYCQDDIFVDSRNGNRYKVSRSAGAFWAEPIDRNLMCESYSLVLLCHVNELSKIIGNFYLNPELLEKP